MDRSNEAVHSRFWPKLWFAGRVKIVAGVVVLLVLGASCSVQDQPNRRAESTSTTEAVSTAPVVPADTAPPASVSVGLVTVGDARYSLDFDCFAPGAGEILAIGVGIDPITETRVEAYVQAFLGTPYLGIEVAAVGEEPVLYEAALERVLEFSFADDVLRADGVDLVVELDLDALTGTPAGVGSVVVECREFLDELPEGFATG